MGQNNSKAPPRSVSRNTSLKKEEHKKNHDENDEKNINVNTQLKQIIEYTGNDNKRINYDKVEKLLKQGANISIIDTTPVNSFGYTIIHDAVLNDRFDIVQLIIKKGGKINTSNSFGYTPLILAIRSLSNNSYKIMKLLLKNGADPLIDSKEHDYPIHIAASESNTEEGLEKLELLVSYLKKNGIIEKNIDLQDKEGRTPLMCAILERSEEAVELLLEENPDLDIQDKSGKTALMLAIARNEIEIVELILQHNSQIPLLNENDKNLYGYIRTPQMRQLINKYIGNENITHNTHKSPRRGGRRTHKNK
jgi:ankyrin repeat protein